MLFKTPPPPLGYHRHFLLPAGLSVDINSVHSLQSHNNPFPSVHFQDPFTPNNYDGLFPSAVSFCLAASLYSGTSLPFGAFTVLVKSLRTHITGLSVF